MNRFAAVRATQAGAINTAMLVVVRSSGKMTWLRTIVLFMALARATFMMISLGEN